MQIHPLETNTCTLFRGGGDIQHQKSAKIWSFWPIIGFVSISKTFLYYSSYLHYIPQSWFKISWCVLKGNAVRAWCKLACSILNSCLVTSHRLNNINLNQKSGFQWEPDIPRKVSNHLDPSWDGSNSTAVKLSQERRELNGETWTK